jgi:hypothetical protein
MNENEPARIANPEQTGVITDLFRIYLYWFSFCLSSDYNPPKITIFSRFMAVVLVNSIRDFSWDTTPHLGRGEYHVEIGAWECQRKGGGEA